MVIDAADLDSGHFMLASNSSEISPDSIFDVWVDPINAVLCAEYKMEIDL